MDLNKFTEKSQAAFLEAQNIATRNQHQAVDVEHLLSALLEQEGGLIPGLLEKARVSPELIKTKLQQVRWDMDFKNSIVHVAILLYKSLLFSKT